LGILDGRVEWIVDLETADGVFLNGAAVEAAAERLRSASSHEWLLAHHPERGCVAALGSVSADDAAAAIQAAEILVREMAPAAGDADRAAPLIAAVSARQAAR
jgi:hypothetical protein